MKKFLWSILPCYLLLLNWSTAQHWQVTEKSAMPESIANNAVCEGEVNGMPYVYTFGGIDSTKLYSGIHLRSYRYDVMQDQWESIPALPDTLGKIAAGASRIGDIIYIIGGYHVFASNNEVSSDRVHRYNTQTNSYLTDGATIPVAIDDQVQAVWRDSLIYVVTGWSNTENVTNVQIYNPSTDEWTAGTPISNEDSYPSFGSSGVIKGDTIYYFGGARNGDFAIQRHLRKGAINPNNPTEITWSAEILNFSIKAYRPGATSAGNAVFWVGGADQTYNFNGIAYSNNMGVEPNNQSLLYRPDDGYFETDNTNVLPMDIRGVASISDSIKYLAGGMMSGQAVTNKTWRLIYQPLPVSVSSPENTFSISLSPNPVMDRLTIETDNCQSGQVSIFNSTGRLLKTAELKDCQLGISVKELSAGQYQLQLQTKDGIAIKSFVKM